MYGEFVSFRLVRPGLADVIAGANAQGLRFMQAQDQTTVYDEGHGAEV